MQRWVWFSDTPVRLIFDDAALYGIVAPVLEGLRQDPSPGARFTVVFESSLRLHDPSEASLIHEGSLGAGLATAGRIYAGPEKEFLSVEGTGSVAIDRLARTASIRIVPGADTFDAATIALYAIDATLAAAGQHLLHGAGLMLPSSDKCVLIFAPSGAGKTTTSLALALDGFELLTDDALVLRTRQPAPMVWGLPRPMKVHRRTVELLPALKSLVGDHWNADGEQVLTRRRFSAAGCVAASEGAPVSAIFLLGKRSNTGHVIAPVSKVDVLLELANDNVGTSRRGVLPRHVKKMEALAELLNHVPAARLQSANPSTSLARQ
jgi:hypothetical protein